MEKPRQKVITDTGKAWIKGTNKWNIADLKVLFNFHIDLDKNNGMRYFDYITLFLFFIMH